MTGYVADLSWKSGVRAIEKLDRLRSTLAILAWIIKSTKVDYGSECVKTPIISYVVNNENYDARNRLHFLRSLKVIYSILHHQRYIPYLEFYFIQLLFIHLFAVTVHKLNVHAPTFRLRLSFHRAGSICWEASDLPHRKYLLGNVTPPVTNACTTKHDDWQSRYNSLHSAYLYPWIRLIN